jgi:hypothetical protein
MFKVSVCEKVENEREIFRKQQEKAPMHLAPGLPDNFDNFINLENRTLQQER